MGGFVTLLTVCAVIAMGKKVLAARRTCTSISDKDSLLKWYNTTTHICKNGIIHPKESTPTPEHTDRHRPNPDPGRHGTLIDLIRNKVIRGRQDANPEATQHKTNRNPSLRADTSCGMTVYEPKTQTCCVKMRYQYKIHDGPQSKHVCCELEAYPRGSTDLPCYHPSMNDPLFEPTNLKRYGKKQKAFCLDLRFKFSLELKQRYMSPTFRHYNATLTPLNSPYAASKHVKVAFEKYSPRKNLDGETLLIISEHNHSEDQTYDFYLQSSDEVYTGTCNTRTLFNRLTKQTRRKCENGKRRRSLI